MIPTLLSLHIPLLLRDSLPTSQKALLAVPHQMSKHLPCDPEVSVALGAQVYRRRCAEEVTSIGVRAQTAHSNHLL